MSVRPARPVCSRSASNVRMGSVRFGSRWVVVEPAGWRSVWGSTHPVPEGDSVHGDGGLKRSVRPRSSVWCTGRWSRPAAGRCGRRSVREASRHDPGAGRTPGSCAPEPHALAPVEPRRADQDPRHGNDRVSVGYLRAPRGPSLLDNCRVSVHVQLNAAQLSQQRDRMISIPSPSHRSSASAPPVIAMMRSISGPATSGPSPQAKSPSVARNDSPAVRFLARNGLPCFTYAGPDSVTCADWWCASTAST